MTSTRYEGGPFTRRHALQLLSAACAGALLPARLLARPEIRAFLPSRSAVAYPEPWMGPVDAMKKLQAWTDTSSLHFRNLAVFGERILLSIRFGDWNSVMMRSRKRRAATAESHS